jgi:adenylate cyclase
MRTSLSVLVFGEPARQVMPERVRRSIAEQEAQAEVLTGWAQLTLVVFFIVLYWLAPTTSEGTPFRPVPYVLAAYLLFTVLRLFLAHRRLLPRWLVLGSVIGDIGLLMVLIWSFHLQYQQPAPFYLKAPTMLYVFIFIALRTLRFEPVYVLTAGVAAAAGWLVLVGYALYDMSGTGPVVTRDFVLYVTPNRVLVGAEVDKVISILLVTLTLALALVRARRTLIRSVAEATAARDLTRFVAPEIADHILSADAATQPGDARIVNGTIMFSDIEGFSTFAERIPPKALMQALNDYFAAVSTIIEQYGGVITQFQGDAMLMTFNTVRPDPDHAANALRSALAIQSMVAERRFGDDGIVMRTRLGINTGEVIVGAVGTRERLLVSVYGDEVNIAARLEPLNKTYGTYVLAAEPTVRAAGAAFDCRPLGTVPVRGREGAVDVFEVMGEGVGLSTPAVTAEPVRR